MPELIADSVNRRFQEELARIEVKSDTKAAEKAEVSQQWLSRRLTGVVPWLLADLERVCVAIGISYTYVATGKREGSRGLISVEELIGLVTDHVDEPSVQGRTTRAKVDDVSQMIDDIVDPGARNGLKKHGKRS